MKKTKRIIPTFATEAEEAEWWFKNRDIHGKELLAAMKSGEAQVLTKEKLLERIARSRKPAAPVVALRIPEADLALARKQAEQKGLPYQTYIKSLLHETLNERERGSAK
jgi:predicted DNA binding CopG/RHH family protein